MVYIVKQLLSKAKYGVFENIWNFCEFFPVYKILNGKYEVLECILKHK